MFTKSHSGEHQMSCGKEPECLLAHKTSQLLSWAASVQQYMPEELHTMAVSKLTSRCALKHVYNAGPSFFPRRRRIHCTI